ncbi:hypothetical protein PGT21_027218 [Puccinia graminis f. sp. tritici]|uniref:Uncharacterized protein n=1 Tax=Puccinia graminis f. sp. tritici TaxID=56615 RepID=A0A5B0SBI9_PUCGR|nr:hypothetical protein PGT21_027218 [Puccinia graminis f. sp. tritici]KAA1135192.1 hypothetical protein PGTUg99_010510 [Puccinia graminis f. sp. tritici]
MNVVWDRTSDHSEYSRCSLLAVPPRHDLGLENGRSLIRKGSWMAWICLEPCFDGWGEKNKWLQERTSSNGSSQVESKEFELKDELVRVDDALRRPGTAGAVAEALPGEMGDQSRQMQFTVGQILVGMTSPPRKESINPTDQQQPISDDRSLHAQSNSSSRCHSSHRCFAAPRHPRHSASLQKVELDSALALRPSWSTSNARGQSDWCRRSMSAWIQGAQGRLLQHNCPSSSTVQFVRVRRPTL